MKKSQWNILRDLINSIEIGKTMTRQHMLKTIFSQTTSGGSAKYGYTVDVYRRYLAMIGILEIVSRGVYEVKNHIKLNASISQIKKSAYSRDWREWFHDFIKV